MSPRSPFARKAAIVIHEAGLAARVEMVSTSVIPPVPNPDVIAHNPSGKIPVLLREDGSALYDSRVICEYLDSLHQGDRIVPTDPARRIEALRLHALGDGLIETLLAWLSERFRKQPEESARRIGHLQVRVRAVLDAIEAIEIGRLEAQPFHLGHVAIGTALAYLDFRFTEEDWRLHRTRTARWHAGFSGRPSVTATAFYDERKPS